MWLRRFFFLSGGFYKMSKRIESGWKSPIYSIQTAREWAHCFWADYPRASDLLLSICGKTVNDTAFLAQKSQRGWECWKFAVKSIEHQYILKDLGCFDNHEHFISYVNQFTIHMLSVLVRNFLHTLENNYQEEWKWLTYWYKAVLE